MNTVYNENMVVLHIKDIMIKKNINRYQLSQMTGIKYDIITKYYNGDCYQIDLVNIAKICSALECDLKDILELRNINEIN